MNNTNPKLNFDVLYPFTVSEWLNQLKRIELIGKLWYGDRDKATDSSYHTLISRAMKESHHFILEDSIMTVMFNFDYIIEDKFVDDVFKRPSVYRGSYSVFYFPDDSKTKLVVSTNLHGWRNIFKSKQLNLKNRQIIASLLHEIKRDASPIFDDINCPRIYSK